MPSQIFTDDVSNEASSYEHSDKNWEETLDVIKK